MARKWLLLIILLVVAMPSTLYAVGRGGMEGTSAHRSALMWRAPWEDNNQYTSNAVASVLDMSRSTVVSIK